MLRRARPSNKPGLAPPGSVREMETALEQADPARKIRNREIRLLRYMWESRDWCAAVADAHPPNDWRDAVLAELAVRVRDAWEENGSPSIGAVRAGLEDPAAMERLAELSFPDGEPLSERELFRLLSLMRDESLRETLGNLRERLAEAQKNGDAAAEEELLAEYGRLQALRKRK